MMTKKLNLLVTALLAGLTLSIQAQDDALPSFNAGKFKYEIVDADNHWVQIAPKSNGAGGYGTLTTNDFVSTVTYNGETYQVKGIGPNAFYGCALSTGRLVLPEGMIYIDDNAFEGAEVGTLRLPSTMQYISDYAFCSNKFQAFGVVSSNPWFTIQNSDQEGVNVSVLTNKSQTTLLAYPGEKAREFGSDGTATYVTSFTVPEQITEIGDMAFAGNSHLTRVTFHNGITRLGMGAFSHSAITGVNITNPDCELGNACFEQCTSLTSVRLPQGMKRLGRHVFFYCSSLSSITLPEGMEEIGMMSLGSCALTTVNLPSTLVKLDTCALQDNPFTSINLKNVRWVGYQCFSMCNNLNSLTSNGLVERFDGLAFARCNGLTNPAILPEGVKTMEMNVFFRSPNFESLTIPSTVECMEGNPAYLANKCKVYRVAEGNTHFVVLDSCIYATNGYTTLPEGTAWPALTEAGTAPTALVGVPTARDNKVLIVPEGVTTICTQAARAVPLTELRLPSTLTELRKMCFTGISTITAVTCLATVPPVVGESAIAGDTYANAVLRVPQASLEAYKTAEGWRNFQHIEGIDDGDPSLPGDLNGDGSVDVEDVNLLINMVLGAVPQTDAADLNGDGTADVVDVNALINLVLN